MATITTVVAEEISIMDYREGEDINIVVFAKDIDGDAMADAASATLFIAWGGDPVQTPLLEYSASPQVTLTVAATAEFLIKLNRTTDLALLQELKTYPVAIWTLDSFGERQVQASGKFRLLAVPIPA